MSAGAPRAARPALAAALLAVALLAGCIGDDPPPASPSDPEGDVLAPGAAGTGPAGATDDGDDAEPGADGPANIAVIHWTPPQYHVGDAWRYDVSGALYPEAFSATFGVIAVDGDRYAIGTDNDAALRAFVHLGGPLLAGLDVNTAASGQDLFGFQAGDGQPYPVTLFGTSFTAVRTSVDDVTHAAGPAGAGMRVTGSAADGGDLLVEYAADAAGMSRLVWRAGDGTTQADWRLASLPDDPTGLVRWDVLDSQQGEASAPPNNLGLESWDSDGAGDKVFLRIVVDPATVARATVLDPSGGIVADVQGDGAQRTVHDVVVPDQAGAWNMVMSTTQGLDVLGLLGGSAKGKVQVFVYQVTESAA